MLADRRLALFAPELIIHIYTRNYKHWESQRRALTAETAINVSCSRARGCPRVCIDRESWPQRAKLIDDRPLEFS